ncbi:MAG TPA: helix-turn-helix transcriptional regulator [Candidatus Woesebacteria bacterium]|nr:helix-turn-helix transcriptional regulator [Candidatus Woesebacteria bacterium]
MTKKNIHFASLFKKYRLRSEIETLAEFGDLLAQEGIVYENSIFTRWQNGERVPTDRKIIIKILKVFIDKGGVKNIIEANDLLHALDLFPLKEDEINSLPQAIELPLTIMQATLGGLIKDFRIQKNISQIELSYALGWKNNYQIDLIEQGKAKKPQRDIIEKISKIMGLSVIEKNTLLLAGNYLPTYEEIQQIREKVRPILNDWQYPAVLLDFSWRIIDQNNKNIIMNKLNKNVLQYIHNTHPTVLDLIFHPQFIANKFFKGQELIEWKNSLNKIIVNYKFAHHSRTKEKWYLERLRRLMKNKLFVESWSQLNYLNIRDIIVTKHGIKTVIYPDDIHKRMKMNFFIVPLLEDSRFEIEYYTPADQLSLEYFKSQSR